ACADANPEHLWPEPDERIGNAKSKCRAVWRRHPVAGRQTNNGAAADVDPAVSAVGQERTARRSRELRRPHGRRRSEVGERRSHFDLPILVQTFPQDRHYRFLVVEDEIVIVDRSHKVVDVVPAGPRARFSRSSGGTSTAVAVNLSEREIREVQQVLVSRGFLHGRVTGVWGPETRDALIAFQRKE